MAAAKEEFNVELIGDSSTGKTRLLLRAVDDIFTDIFISSIGVPSRKLETNSYKIKIYDYNPIHAQENTPYIRPKYTVVNFDISNKDTFIYATNWIRKESQKNGRENERVILAGNKCDLKDDRKVSYDEAKSFAEENGCILYMETSAKDNINCHKLFEEIYNHATKKIQAKEDSDVTIEGLPSNHKPLFDLARFKNELVETQKNSPIKQGFKSVFFKENSSLVNRVLQGKSVSYKDIKEYAGKNRLGTVHETLKKFDTSKEDEELQQQEAAAFHK